MQWLALFLPRFALDLAERSRLADGDSSGNLPETRPSALAIVDRLEILLANEAALAGGIRPGSRKASAQALLPGIQLLERTPANECQAIENLACWALQFTPLVCLLAPDDVLALARTEPIAPSEQALRPKPAKRQATARPQVDPGRAGLLLEIGASLRLFGGRETLQTRILAELHALGYCACIADAPTASGAWLLARAAVLADPPTAIDGAADIDTLRPRLEALPLHLLAHAGPHLAALASIGASSIASLNRLPRAGIARRFGKALLEEVDRAFGHTPEVLPSFEAPSRFASRLELLAQVESTEALLFAARRMLAELTGWLAARHAGARAFELHAEHDDHQPTRLDVRLTDPSRDPTRLFGVLRERLNTTRLPAPTHTLRLSCTELQALAPESNTLFPSPRSSSENLARLLERLQARLGREHVQQLCVTEDHRPEAASRTRIIEDLRRITPAPVAHRSVVDTAATTSATGSFTPIECGLPRPLWMLDEPVALAERNNQPWWRGALVLLAGPERIETGWWDEHLVQRDYFIAEDETGHRYWIYRERTASGPNRPGWYLQGHFG